MILSFISSIQFATKGFRRLEPPPPLSNATKNHHLAFQQGFVDRRGNLPIWRITIPIPVKILYGCHLRSCDHQVHHYISVVGFHSESGACLVAATAVTVNDTRYLRESYTLAAKQFSFCGFGPEHELGCHIQFVAPAVLCFQHGRTAVSY
ncbi:hypothetical protein Tsp_01568 [Trichinella spiralis]|uniref:hypothetical protein n=1 Tax=Trichinella spiralis TaxID=6334 RepID=UPI0001EFC08A|nr:hypothetical protein Tsp_01568 [Trichinella spiralis]